MESDSPKAALARIPLLLFLALPWCAGESVFAEGKAQNETNRTNPPVRQFSGLLTFTLENDLFLYSGDDNYTAGTGLSWVSDDVAAYGERRFERRVARAFGFLPKVCDDGYRTFVSFTLGQEMYTPTDIEAPVPPPDQQPYAGVLFVDSSVYAHGPRSMFEYSLRLGCVGPCSGADSTQRVIHGWVGSPIPQGWDYQLDNEPILNLGYQYHHRIVRAAHHDLALQAGAGLGNYYIGGNFGGVFRAGWALPDTYSTASLRTGGASRFAGLDTPPGRRWRAFGFVGLEVYGVARFLPTDGNTFRESPSVDRGDVIGALATGLAFGRGPVLVTWTRNSIAGFNDLPDSRAQDFGTIMLSFYVGRRHGKTDPES